MADINYQDQKYANSYSIDHMQLRLDKIEQRISALEERRSLANRLVPECELVSNGPPKIYQLPFHSSNPGSDVSFKKVVVGKLNEGTRKPERTILMVGATGGGKSALVDAIANFILGVKWGNCFRFKVTKGERSQSQSHSQTNCVMAYTFHNTMLPYSLTIIDTPGFTNTSGCDMEITRHFRDFLSHNNEIHGICFVTPGCHARLTPAQYYVFNSVLSLFGKDLRDSIFLMTTFCDIMNPPVIEAVKAAQIPFKHTFKFNYCSLFSENHSSDKLNCMFWEMGACSLKQFFHVFSAAIPQSLQMTSVVLSEKEKIAVMVNSLQAIVKMGLQKLNEMDQVEEELEQHLAAIRDNKYFQYTVGTMKTTKVFHPAGVYENRCVLCSFTCHSMCCHNNDLKQCWAMDDNGFCNVCPRKCYMFYHSLFDYYFQYETVYETKTHENIKQRYDAAQSGKRKCQSTIENGKAVLIQLQNEVYTTLNQMRSSIKILNDSALRPNSLSETDYLDLLIECERREHKIDWGNRARQFEKIKTETKNVTTAYTVPANGNEKLWWRH